MTNDKPVRVRIAPSPTGDPHVGTAYMALFNRALADKRGGEFIFRLDDTDRKRYSQTSEAQLHDTLAWLGFKFDEGPHMGGPNAPYRQSERLHIYRKYLDKLLLEGKAYRCFCTSERLGALREKNARGGRASGYDRHCRDLSPDDVQAKLDANEAWTVRLKMPLEGEVAFTDVLRGPISFPAPDLDDKIIFKADGFPTYHLANVVDDHEFRITHIIRGEEWISSVPLHIVLMEALGVQPPVFIHMPLLRNPDKSKVSKRRNPTSLHWYREAGFLPEGMKNFLGRLGFSLPDDQEVFTYDEFLTHFEPERINTGSPVFDLQKLEWLNGEQINLLSDDDFEVRLAAHIQALAGRVADFQPLPDDDPVWHKRTYADKFRLQTQDRNLAIATSGAAWLENREMIHKLIPLLKPRAHTLSEATVFLPPFFEELPKLPLEDLEKVKKFTPEEILAALEAGRAMIESTDFTPVALEEAARALCEERGWKVGPPFMTWRLAVLRSKVSPPLFESMEVLGRGLTLKRLTDARDQWSARGV